MVTQLPYEFQEGQKAYAAKVMANFYEILGKLNGVIIDGVGQMDIDAALSYLRQQTLNKVQAGEVGNAQEIVFADGETMQKKLNDGDFNGTDGVVSTSDGMYYFYVGDNGHLMLVTRSQVQGDAFVINEQGHLIYTISEPGTDQGSPVVYDLGNVRGQAGESGMQASVYDPHGKAQDVFAYVDTKVSQSQHSTSVNTQVGTWTNGEAQILVEGITSLTNFYIGPQNSATAEQRSAWRSAVASVVSQTDEGVITLVADGTTPDMAIPLTIVILP